MLLPRSSPSYRRLAENTRSVRPGQTCVMDFDLFLREAFRD